MQPTNQTDNPAAFFRGTKGLAAYLGVSSKTIERAVRARRLPVVKLGGVLLFRRADVEAALEAATIHAVTVKRNRKGGAA
jgi:excisionase family DNA binding protein